MKIILMAGWDAFAVGSTWCFCSTLSFDLSCCVPVLVHDEARRGFKLYLKKINNKKKINN